MEILLYGINGMLFRNRQSNSKILIEKFEFHCTLCCNKPLSLTTIYEY